MSIHDRHGPVVRHEQVHIADSSGWKKLPLAAGAIGIIALGAGFALKGGHEQKFFYSYLTAYMTFLALSLGGLFFVLVQHASRAGWSIAVRRLAEHMTLTLPVMGLLALPIVFMGAHDLYHWTHAEVVADDPILSAKQSYLNTEFFTVRALVYIAVWSLLAFLFWNWSTKQDHATDPKPLSHKMRWVSPLGLVFFALTLTFGAFDWMMSLDPHWFSTIFGVYYFAGTVLCGHAFLAIIVILLHRSGYLRGVVTKEHFHDLGKMMFAFTVFWAYIGFSQYMLIWYASIPEETQWYAYRGHGDFLTLSLVLVFARFVFPFLGLISRHIKRNPRTLMFWAVWLVVAQFIDMYWLVQPALAHHHGSFDIHLDHLDLLPLLGIGGLWFSVFAWGLVNKPLVPLKDPRLEESVHFENF